jgi:multicomponent Na+:H+ antiporter subunit D
VAVLVVSTLLNAGYFLPIVYAAFFKPPREAHSSHGEAPVPILLAMGATALLSVFLFAFADQPFELAALLAAGE